MNASKHWGFSPKEEIESSFVKYLDIPDGYQGVVERNSLAFHLDTETLIAFLGEQQEFNPVTNNYKANNQLVLQKGLYFIRLGSSNMFQAIESSQDLDKDDEYSISPGVYQYNYSGKNTWTFIKVK